MKTFFKKHLAMSITFPVFVLYIFLLPYKKDVSNVNGDKNKKEMRRNEESGLERKSIPKPEAIDKAYAVSWIFSINTNQ